MSFSESAGKRKHLTKVKKFRGTGLKIVDDTEDAASLSTSIGKRKQQILPESASDDEADELPVFVGVVDERPLEVQALEEFKVESKWKKVGNSNEAERDAIPPHNTSKMGKTLDGKQAGLQRASALRDEMIEHRKRETRFFESLDDSVSGQNAKTVFRDRKTGTKRDLEAEAISNKKKEKLIEKRAEQYNKWGKGLKQVEEREDRISSTLHEMAKPLARYKDDDDLERFLKDQDRDGDPMLKFLSKNSKQSGKPTYSGPPPPPNRFHIPPGCRWDGVDRSNGYEKEYFSKINTRKALDEEAYKWSVEDL